MTFLTPGRITWITQAVFAALALFFLGMALGAVFAPDLGALPGWLGAPVGLIGAVLLFSAAWFAPRRAANIAFDEGYQHDWLHAQARGYWAFVFAFAIGGNLVAADILPAGRAFMACSLGAAAVPFVWFLARRWGGRG